MTPSPSSAGKSTLEQVATANLGVIIAMSVSKPVSPARHLMHQAKKLYSCTSSGVSRWLVAMDREYILKVVYWRFNKNFGELRSAILSELDSGYESLQFVLQVAPRFMPSLFCSSLLQVSRDYLWSKTIIEQILRVWPLAASSARDRDLFREVIIQLYEYIAKSLIKWLARCVSSTPKDSPYLQELSKVTDLLLNSVQCIAHHGSLRIAGTEITISGIWANHVIITKQPELSEDLLAKHRVSAFTGEIQKTWEATFVDQIRSLHQKRTIRKSSSKLAEWFAVVMPQEAKRLRPDLIPANSASSPVAGPSKSNGERPPTLAYVKKLRKLMRSR